MTNQRVWFRVQVQRVVHSEDPNFLVVEPPRPGDDSPDGIPDAAKLAFIRSGNIRGQGELEGKLMQPRIQVEGLRAVAIYELPEGEVLLAAGGVLS